MKHNNCMLFITHGINYISRNIVSTVIEHIGIKYFQKLNSNYNTVYTQLEYILELEKSYERSEIKNFETSSNFN